LRRVEKSWEELRREGGEEVKRGVLRWEEMNNC
jgi:hypothetical protein